MELREGDRVYVADISHVWEAVFVRYEDGTKQALVVSPDGMTLKVSAKSLRKRPVQTKK